MEFECVANALHDSGCIKFGEFTLKNGTTSPYYIDLGRLPSFPSNHKPVIINAFAELVKKLQLTPTLLADVPTRVTGLVSSLSDRLSIPQITPRLDQKRHGSGAKIQGVYSHGERVALIDDVITDGGSKLEAVEILRANGLVVEDVLVLVDREQGGKEELAKHGCTLHAFTDITSLARFYFSIGLMTEEQFQMAVSTATHP